MELDLAGRTAIVTGAGRGIGETIAESFAEAGATVVAVARTDTEIENTADRINAHGGDALAIPADLGEPDDIAGLIDATVEEVGAADILVNNAALNLVDDPGNYDPEHVDSMLRVNLRGVLLLTQRFARAFRASSGTDGRVVNISSIAATRAIPGMAAYGGTKAGVNGLTTGLAAELAPYGIRVNAVSPGLTDVDRIERLIDERGETLYNLDRIPLDRLCTPMDIANACLYFSSDLGSYVTGQMITVDGGVSFTTGLYQDPTD